MKNMNMSYFDRFNNKMQYWFDRLFYYCQKENFFFLILLLVSVISFSYELFNFTLSIDEELAMVKTGANKEWISQGRWAMYFISILFYPNPIFPIIPLLFTLVCNVVAIMIIMAMFDKPDFRFEKCIASILFLTCPILYYIYHFSTFNFGVGFGFLISSIGMYIFISVDNRMKLVSILFFCFAIGVYQSFVVFFCTLYSFYMLYSIMFKSRSIKLSKIVLGIFEFIFYLVISLILYYLISKAVQYIYDIDPSSYVGNYFQFELKYEYFQKTILEIFENFKLYYFGGDRIYFFPVLSLFFLSIFSYICVFIRVLKLSVSFDIKIFSLLLVLIIPLIPFGINVIAGGRLPPRVMVGIPLVISLFTFFSLLDASKIIKLVISSLAILVIFQFCMRNNQMAFSNHLSWQADRELTNRIVKRIESEYSKFSNTHINKAIPLVITGKINAQRNIPILKRHGTLGLSFWNIGKGTGRTSRLIHFMRSMGIQGFVNGHRLMNDKKLEEVNKMPEWPAENSVKMVNNVLVIKL